MSPTNRYDKIYCMKEILIIHAENIQKIKKQMEDEGYRVLKKGEEILNGDKMIFINEIIEISSGSPKEKIAQSVGKIYDPETWHPIMRLDQ